MAFKRPDHRARVLLAAACAIQAALLLASCVTSDDDEETADAEEVVAGQYAQNSVADPDSADASNVVAAGEDEVANSVLESAGESNAIAQGEGNATSDGGNVSADDEQALAELVGEDPQPPAENAAADESATPPDAATNTAPPDATAEQGPSVLPSGPVEVVPATPVAPPVVLSTLSWIGYNYRARDGILQIDLKTRGNPAYNVFQEVNKAGQPELVVRLFQTRVRKPIRRPVDASEFRSPVSFIRTRGDARAQHVDVILTLREAVQPKMMASESGLSLTYRIPDHWYGIRREGNIAKATPSEVAEPLAGANLFPVFDQGSRMPERIESSDATKASEPVTEPAAESIPPQGAIQFHPAGAAWQVGQDNTLGLDNSLDNAFNAASPVNAAKQGTNAAAVAPDAAVLNAAEQKAVIQQEESTANQANIAAIAANPGKELDGQDQAGKTTSSSQRKINLDFRGAPLSEVIKAITDKSGVNFVYSGAIASIPVTIQLQDIAWDVAFKSILDLNGLGLVRIADNLYRVDQLGNIAREKEQIEAAKIASQRLEPTRIMFLRLSYAQAGDAVALVNEMLANARTRDPRIQIRAEQRTNSLIVEAPSRELARVKALVERIDLQTPQVKIESRVVEVVKTLNKTLGISWGAPLFFDQSRGLGFGSLPFPNFMRSDFAIQAGGTGSGIGSMNFIFGSINNSFNLDLHLRMTENEKLTETLQTNSVIVQNNQSANITGGQSDVFVLGSSAPGTAPQVLSVDYNLNVAVTPTVTADGAVRMTMSINSSSPTGASPGVNATLGRVSRSISTVLLRRSGETAVIGGLNTRERSNTWDGIPILSRIPILGALFRSSDRKQSNRELLIMVTPTILNVAAATGDNGNATFDEDAGTASSSSPDKLDTSGADSEFTAEDIENPSTGVDEMAELSGGNESSNANASGNASGNNSANALDEAIEEINGAGESESGKNNAVVNDSANNAIESGGDNAANLPADAG